MATRRAGPTARTHGADEPSRGVRRTAEDGLPRRLRACAGAARRHVPAGAHGADPRPGRVLLLGGKSIVAAVAAWEAAGWWDSGTQQYLAVSTALLMVNAGTVYRSITDAARRMAVRLAGISLASASAWLLGSTLASVVVVLAIALLVGGKRAFDDRLQVASTAVLSLTMAAAASFAGVGSLVVETVAGAVIGVLVNAVILPPISLPESEAAVRGLARDMGALLREMGGGLAERRHEDHAAAWLHRARSLERRFADAAAEVSKAQESLRWNTRCAVHRQRGPVTYREAFEVLNGVSLQVRGIARTLADNALDAHDRRLGRLFVDRYAQALQWAGHAVEEFVGEEALPDGVDARERLHEAIRLALDWHDDMTGLVGTGALLKPGAWHVYGSLMTDIERLLADLDRANLPTS